MTRPAIDYSEAAAKKYRKGLKNLSESVAAAIRMLDDEMKKPSDAMRGQRIARICNGLELANDSARRFSLGLR